MTVIRDRLLYRYTGQRCQPSWAWGQGQFCRGGLFSQGAEGWVGIHRCRRRTASTKVWHSARATAVPCGWSIVHEAAAAGTLRRTCVHC
jgi:hypothetical protein